MLLWLFMSYVTADARVLRGLGLFSRFCVFVRLALTLCAFEVSLRLIS
jgi:hypothetical protein